MVNDRIKVLWKQAESHTASTSELRDRFAELIVQECVEVVKWTPSQYPNDEYVKNIKAHFGVES